MTRAERDIDTIRRLHTVIKELESEFVGRAEAAHLVVLAALCREHVLLLGPPGTGKTELITKFSRMISARQFNYLLTRFTEPSEIFGPLDFEQFRKGNYRILTEKMLPDADVAFLDEVFHGSSAILNTLLTLINERYFHNGANLVRVPLTSVFGASSELPEDPALRAFSDRFLLRVEVAPVAGTQLPELLEQGWALQRDQIRDTRFEPDGDRSEADARPEGRVSLDGLFGLFKQLPFVSVDGIRPLYAELIADLIAQGVTLSDRRIVRGLKLIAGAALLREEWVARARDFWPLNHIWAEAGDADQVRAVVGEFVAQDGGPSPAPGTTSRVLVARARQRARQLDQRTGPMTRQAIMAALRDLNTIEQALRADHPHETDGISTVRNLITDITQRLTDAE